ncbi:NADH-quinone oxidoreductase subunit N [Phycisphaerae bacterium RAS1]|nr:NADH-quinone oxidoreductase subunit N [Phycisphaerae bacterium RAS1]
MTIPLASMWMPDAATMQLVAPELILTAAIAALLLVPLAVGRNTSVSLLLALIGVLAAATVGVGALGDRTPGDGHSIELFGPSGPAGASPGMLVVDRFGGYFRALLLLFLAAILVMWQLFEARRERHAPEFLTLLLCSGLGMILMAGTSNLLMMIVAIELASLPSYALAGFERQRRAAGEAALKYSLFGAATSGFMIFGASLLFGLTGSLHIPTIVQHLTAVDSGPASAALLALALLTIFAGVGFKISAVPFHFWCPDVFEGASITIATWLSVASKAAGLVLVVRVASLCGGMLNDAALLGGAYEFVLLPILRYGLAAFAAITCTVANLAAYRQTSVRRLLAYSSIAHAGYMLAVAPIISRSADSPGAAMSALAAYLAVYLFMNLGAFLALALVAVDRGREDVEAFTGLGWRDPATAASLTVCLVSLIGLPPVGGFVAKFLLIAALGRFAVADDAALLWGLVTVVVINTAISLFYYARIIRQMYLRGESEPATALAAPAGAKLVLHVCAVVLLLTGTLSIGALKRTADSAAVRAAPPAVRVSDAHVFPTRARFSEPRP